MILELRFLLIKGSNVFLSMKIVIGTPHDLCLETHQSGLSKTMERILFLLEDGIQFTFSISFNAFFLSSSLSIEINHCEVVLKINGAFDRHECG